jgi:filamentous hemagglutinin family protein
MPAMPKPSSPKPSSPARHDFSRPGRKPIRLDKGRAAWLAGVSALTLLAGAPAGRAGNILVPGGATSAVNAATASAMAASQQAAAMAAQAQSSLSRATQAIQAMQAAQSAARNLALAGANHLAGMLDVPRGLSSAGAGGLVPDSGLVAPGIANPVTSWAGANTPTQSSSNGRTTVDIQQTAAQAILNWRTFNVSKDTTVNFDQQGNASWVALNRIQDPSGVPSQILGQIKAPGQVYLINRNGIIFGGSAQVNVNALIASSADISTSQFLNNGIYSPLNSGTYTPSFTAAGGAVTVQPGAEIVTNAPGSVTSGGGFVLLMGTQVDNQGTILTPDGQTELAAGSNFVPAAGP